MPTSYSGKILHVDLTESRWWTEELDEQIYRKYLGGGALATYFMLRDMKPGIDPLGPDNLLMFMTSVINGLPLSGANRYTAAGKSPLTGGFGEAEAGGDRDRPVVADDEVDPEPDHGPDRPDHQAGSSSSEGSIAPSADGALWPRQRAVSRSVPSEKAR